jgi:hypothetical protein
MTSILLPATSKQSRLSSQIGRSHPAGEVPAPASNTWSDVFLDNRTTCAVSIKFNQQRGEPMVSAPPGVKKRARCGRRERLEFVFERLILHLRT